MGWGRNDHGQVGGKEEAPRPKRLELPEALKKEGGVKQLTVGAEHNVALSAKGNLWCWGWNEHGQLGVGDIEDRFDPSPIHSVPQVEEGSIHSLVSGYGFSLLLLFPPLPATNDS